MHEMAMNGPGMHNMMSMGGQHCTDMLVPGNKVGLIIGKGGETIKTIQERCHCKIMFTQDISIPSDQEKSLRITGDPSNVEIAKKMVADVMFNDRGMPQHQSGGGRTIQTIAVPRPMVGMVIGKGGEIIRKIQDDFGVRLQFDQDNKVSPERMCTVTGPPDRVKDAIDRVNQIMYGGSTMGMPMQRQMPRDQGGRVNGGGDGRNETTFAVPAEKCGLVIGKSGVTINEIKIQSGAHVEIQRQQHEGMPQKLFTIVGDPQQTQKAIELISQKIGGGPETAPAHSYATQYAATAPITHQAQPQAAYAQGWGDASLPYASQPYSQQAVPVTTDPSAGAMAADWGTYYAQSYWGQTAAQQPHTTAAATTQQAIGQEAAGQQPNYAQQWYDYYNATGQFEQANLLLLQQQQAHQHDAIPR